MKEPINKIYTECKQKGRLVTQLQGQSQGLGLCRQLNQTSGQAVARRHHPRASFLTVQGLLCALGPLMDPNSNSSLLFVLAVGFHLDNEQSYSRHIAILLVLTLRRGQDLAQRKEGRLKYPSRGQPRMILAHLDLRNSPKDTTPCAQLLWGL